MRGSVKVKLDEAEQLLSSVTVSVCWPAQRFDTFEVFATTGDQS